MTSRGRAGFRRLVWSGAAAALLVTAGPGAGAEGGSNAYDPKVAFAEADTNRDGAVDHEEFHLRMVEVFYAADADKDGFLSPEEMKRLTFPEDFKASDKDASGRLSLREFLRVRFRDFERVDTNDDEALDLNEVIEVYEGKGRR